MGNTCPPSEENSPRPSDVRGTWGKFNDAFRCRSYGRSGAACANLGQEEQEKKPCVGMFLIANAGSLISDNKQVWIKRK